LPAEEKGSAFLRRLKPQHASGNYLIKLPNKSYLGGLRPRGRDR